MCHLDVYIYRYPGGYKETENVWHYCRPSRQARPQDCRDFYREEITEHFRDVDSRPMSSAESVTSSRRGSSIAPSVPESTPRRRSSRTGPPPMAGLFLNAFMGERRRSTRRSSRSEAHTIVIEERIPSIYPSTPSPMRASFDSGSQRFTPSPMSQASPLTPRFSGTWEADIVDASPYRGRRGTPVIVENGSRPRRSASTEVHSGRTDAPPRARSPSPITYDMRRREEERATAEARRRRRDVEIAMREHEIAEGRARQRRSREERLHDDEIRSRPSRPSVVQQNSPPKRPGILRTQSVKTSRDEVIEDLRMSERGEKVIRDAIAARDAAKREEELETERRRLARRFARGSERVEYRDDPYRR